jgi:sigma-E factor negative regulatory protein RseA
MSNAPMDEAASRERLSALVDGELDPGDCAVACAHWRGSVEVRRDWHTWQLIGDVLRSDDLASDAAHDARFLATLRDRLATEPVVLAPTSIAARDADGRTRAGRWMLPSAIAAGFVLVVGTFAVLQPGTGSAPAPVAIAENTARPAADAVQPAAPAGVDAQAAVVADGKLIRDGRLDRYLAAHKQFAGTSALGVPSAFLRGATVDAAATR